MQIEFVRFSIFYLSNIMNDVHFYVLYFPFGLVEWAELNFWNFHLDIILAKRNHMHKIADKIGSATLYISNHSKILNKISKKPNIFPMVFHFNVLLNERTNSFDLVCL